MTNITSIEFLLFVLAQEPDRKYDMRDELRESEVGSPLLHFVKKKGIMVSAVGSMDVYNAQGKVTASLEMPTQHHFNYLDMEKGGTYGDLQLMIRDCHLRAISASFGEPINTPPPMRGKLISRRLIPA